MRKLQKKDIQVIVGEQKKFLRDNFEVKRVGIFGSFARGENRVGSDVDMIVEFYSPIGFFSFLRLERFLSKILKRKVDLVTKRALKRAIKNDILREVVYI